MSKFFLALVLMFAALVSFSVPASAQQQPQPQPSAGPSPPPADWGSSVPSEGQKKLSEWEKTFSDPAQCWGCTLFQNMARVTLSVGKRGEALFVAGAIASMNAFMSLWVVWQLFLLLSPSHAHSPAQSIDAIFIRLVLMMVILFVLQAGPFNLIMEKFVFPTIGEVMEMSSKLIGSTPGCPSAGTGDLVQSGTGLMCSMHVEMGKGVGLGMFLMTDADFRFYLGYFELFQAFGGAIIFLAFGIMLVIMPFRLFDAMIRLAVVSVILPVVVFAYQFKPTRGATKQAATSVLASALTFLFTAIAVAITVELLRVVTSPVLANVGDNSPESFIGPLNGSQFMVLVASAVGMAAFIRQAGTLAAEFAGFQGQMGNVGGAGAAAVGAAAATGGAALGYGAVRGLGAARGAVGRAMTKKVGPQGGAGGVPAGPGQVEAAPR